MASGINIAIDVDESGATKGIKSVDEALEKVGDALNDVSKEGGKDLGQLESDIKDLSKTSLKSSEQMGGRIGSDFKKGTKEASEGIDDLKENSKSNAKEVAASFDGSVQSIADGFQGLAAEAFEGFGPAGLLAGAAIAAGIGLATKSFEDQATQTEAAKQAISELAAQYIKAGGVGQRSFEDVASQVHDLATETDDSKISLEKIRKESQGLGLDFVKVTSNYLKGTDAINEQIKEVEKLQQAHKDLAKAALQGGTALADDYNYKSTQYQKQLDYLKLLKGEAEAAKKVEEDWLNIGGDVYDAKAAAISTINKAYDDAVGSVLDFVDQETGALDIAKFAAHIQARKDALEEYQTDLATLGLSTEQKNALNDMGFEAAQRYLEGIKKGTPEQVKFFKDALTEAAGEASGTAKQKLEDGFKVPTKAGVEVEVNPISLAAANKKIEDIVANRKLIIELDVRKGSLVP